MSKRLLQVLLACIVLAGVGLRSYQLTARSLWFDEAFSWRLIQFPFNDMLARAAADVHPPLYYILLRGWSGVFGDSLQSLRSFSVAAGGLTILAAYIAGAAAFRSRVAGLAGAAAITAAAFQIQYAWEARMYTLGTALALLSAWVLLRAVRSERWQWWLLYGVLAAAFAYTHYYAFFTLAAHALFVVGGIVARTRGRIGEILQWRSSWYAAGAALLAIVLYAPWLPTFLAQRSQVQESFWIPAIGGWSIPDTFYRFYWPTSGIPLHEGVGWIVLALLPIMLTGMLWAALARLRPRDGSLLVLLCGLVPFLAAIALSLLTSRSIYQDRFFVFAHLFILIGWAGLLTKLPWRTLRRAAPLLFVMLLLLTSVRYWHELDIKRRPGAHAATSHLFSQRQGEQPVLVSSPFVYFAIRHYAEHEFNSTAPRLYSETGTLAHFAGGPILTPEDSVGLEVFTAPADTLWIVDTTGFGGQTLIPPDPWRAGETKAFPEVFPYQGEVSVTRYRR